MTKLDVNKLFEQFLADIKLKNPEIYREFFSDRLEQRFILRKSELIEQVKISLLLTHNDPRTKAVENAVSRFYKVLYTKVFPSSHTKEGAVNLKRLSAVEVVYNNKNIYSKLDVSLKSAGGTLRNIHEWMRIRLQKPKNDLYDELKNISGLTDAEMNTSAQNLVHIGHMAGSVVSEKSVQRLADNLVDFVAGRGGSESLTDDIGVKLAKKLPQLKGGKQAISTITLQSGRFNMALGRSVEKKKYNLLVKTFESFVRKVVTPLYQKELTKYITEEASNELTNICMAQIQKAVIDSTSKKGATATGSFFRATEEVTKIAATKINKKQQLKLAKAEKARERVKSQSYNELLAIKQQINNSLPGIIQSRMSTDFARYEASGSPINRFRGDPGKALNYRTGTLSRTAKVESITPVVVGDTSRINIEYSTADKYDAYKPGSSSSLYSPARSTTKLVGGTVRDLAIEFMVQKFGLIDREFAKAAMLRHIDQR